MGQQTSESGTPDRKGEHRRLATEGLSVREIAERTGNPKSTVHRDLEGWEAPASEPTEAEIQAVIDEDPRQYGPASARLLIFQRRGEKPPKRESDLTAKEMTDRADELYQAQIEARGIVKVTIDGKKLERPGPYVPTPETEARGREILRLRKAAAKLKYPTRRVEAA